MSAIETMEAKLVRIFERPAAELRAVVDREVLHLSDMDAFEDRLSQESLRHRRSLEGYGIVRISPTLGRHGGAALKEAVQTELRRSDAAATYSDGSFVILLAGANRHAVEVVVRRLIETARELVTLKGGHTPEYAAGAACADGRRTMAGELWSAAEEAWRMAIQAESQLVVARWD